MQTTWTPDTETAALLQASVPAQSWQLATLNPMLRIGGMSPYRPTRREFLIGAAGLLVLAPYGCGGAGEGSGGGRETASGGTRTVEHALGTTEVPSDPQRLIVLETSTLDAALTLGITPIAAPQTRNAFPDYLGEATEGIEPLSPPTTEPNLEAIAALEPDMILSSAFEGEVMSGYENLSEIAPTVEGKEASTLRLTEAAALIYGANTFNGTVLNDAGVTLAEPPAGVEETYGYYEVSMELLPRSRRVPDILFLYSTEPGVVEDVTTRPLWNELEAVQQNLALQVDFEHWQRGVGYAAANAILNDLEKHLLEEQG